MPSTDSGDPEKVDAMPLEQVVGMTQNEWTASIGIDGRHGPDYAPPHRQPALSLAGARAAHCPERAEGAEPAALRWAVSGCAGGVNCVLRLLSFPIEPWRIGSERQEERRM